MPERAPIRTAVPVALVAAGLLLTACGTATEATAPPAAPPAAPSEITAATPAGTLGGPGTACALPASLTLAKGWKPQAVKDPENPELAPLTRQGPATVRCEVDAKPAGNIGYLRVWTAPKGPARATLEAFVKAEKGATGLVVKDVKAGALPAVEVRYSVHSEVLDDTKEERAFAVETPKGTVIVHLGGLDSEEHQEMLPAYELAKSSLKAL
ncbi:lipoprotein [Streptomyces sp. NPDC085481]|uniref:lipoprotein n=1 Tax=Streptomyces sp. NPDC085481 TaxID=3365727 RepID=UPI0037D3AD35